MDKIFISAEELLQASFELALHILESDYRPSFIVGVWRGGTPIGIAIQELLDVCGCPTDHFSIRTSSYEHGTKASQNVQVYGLQHLVDTINRKDNLLIVDDTFDSGRSIEAIITHLQKKSRRNTPQNIKVATIYYKPTLNTTNRTPDFFIYKTDRWIVFPHELHGCTLEEIHKYKVLPKKAYKYKFNL